MKIQIIIAKVKGNKYFIGEVCVCVSLVVSSTELEDISRPTLLLSLRISKNVPPCLKILRDLNFC